MEINNHYVKQLFELALAEDIGIGDVTSNVIIPKDRLATGIILSKDTGLVAGLEVIELLLCMVNSQLTLTSILSDGDKVEPGVEIGKIQGPARAMLEIERTALNFLRRLSGIATLTSKYVQAVAGYPVKIIDTRKTTPGWRILEKYAVRVGGGYNHRFGLYDAVLIKDNHIALAGSITKAIEMARAQIPHTMTIEIETKTLQQVSEALNAKADIIMLDNMTLDKMKDAVKLIDGKVPVEASGNVQLETVKQVAATGVDLISVGALTHSAPALDISLDVMVV
ncbi:TPA: carboxylating nicotinate-nucleotide diphosphorylase [Candidatus Poribacteria bacterium]|nr:carboxylating nicotinate-nucleotide diphosphorylase [Candidatus Poribacteria bacterium]